MVLGSGHAALRGGSGAGVTGATVAAVRRGAAVDVSVCSDGRAHDTNVRPRPRPRAARRARGRQERDVRPYLPLLVRADTHERGALLGRTPLRVHLSLLQTKQEGISFVGFRRGLDLHADGSAGKPVGRVRVLPAVVRASPCSVRGPGRTPEDSVGARPGHLHLLIRSGPGSVL